MLAVFLFSVIGFFAVIAFCIAIYLAFQNRQDKKNQDQRVKQAIESKPELFVENNANRNQEEGIEAGLRRDSRISSIPWLNDIFSKVLKKNAKSLIILIEQSGLKVKVGEFLLLTLFVGLTGFMLVNTFLHIPVVGFGLAIVPYLMLNFLKEKRTADFVKQMPQALDLISSDLRAGLDVQAALKHLSDEFPAPIGEEFGKVIVEINLGLPISDALNNLAKRINTMDVQILCTGIIINRELGGNLAELTSSIGNTVRERFRLKGMIKALTAENQGSAILLMVLPVGLYLVLNMLAPAVYNSFATDPIGKMILISCAVSMTFGYLVIQKITKLEV